MALIENPDCGRSPPLACQPEDSNLQNLGNIVVTESGEVSQSGVESAPRNKWSPRLPHQNRPQKEPFWRVVANTWQEKKEAGC